MKTGEDKNFEVFKEAWYRESILTIHNLSEMAFILLDLGREDLLATVTELMQVEAQAVSDEYCTIKEASDDR